MTRMTLQKITESIVISERIKEELMQLDEMIQVYQKVEDIVKANEQIQKNNLFFAVFQWSHSDSLMIRLRRLVDKDDRTGSLWYLCKFIAKHAVNFDKAWFASFYAGTPVENMAVGWWRDVSTASGDHVWERQDEDITYAANELDRDVVSEDQIRTVIRCFKDQCLPICFPGRTQVPKTLIFAKNDSHADDIVNRARTFGTH